MKGCVQCLRIILVVFNFLVVLIGLAVLGFSVFIYLESGAQDFIYALDYHQTIQSILYVLMGIGGFTLVVALFGCCGAYHDSQCLLVTYFITLIVIFAIQVTGVTLGYVYRDKITQYVDDRMRKGVGEYLILRDQRENSVAFMDNIQRMLRCCGVDSYKDYGERIPVACCDRVASTCMNSLLNPNEVFQEGILFVFLLYGSMVLIYNVSGCKEKYKTVFKDKLMILFLTTLSIAAFEIFCLLFAMIMCCTIRQYYSDYYGADYSMGT